MDPAAPQSVFAGGNSRRFGAYSQPDFFSFWYRKMQPTAVTPSVAW